MQDGNANENVTFKYINLISFVLLHDYFHSFNFYRNGEIPRNQIGRSGVRVNNANEKFAVVFSRSPKSLEFGHSMLLFCRGRLGKVPQFKTHVQGDCFCSFNLSSFAALSLPSLSLFREFPKVPYGMKVASDRKFLT